MLASPLFEELFDIMQEHYSWVIIDSPPVLAVTDATLLARRSSGVIFVVGSAMTSSRIAIRAVEDLRQAGANLLGTVLNRADLKHHPFYFSPYLRGERRREPPADVRATPKVLGIRA
jgi:Mrp family chromosome partitioning ATPase